MHKAQGSQSLGVFSNNTAAVRPNPRCGGLRFVGVQPSGCSSEGKEIGNRQKQVSFQPIADHRLPITSS
jgi:hypothetical protein